MAITLVRTHPIEIYYVTGNDARESREAAGLPDDQLDGPCFTTSMMGDDGFAWNTAKEFEEDYAEAFGGLNPPSKSSHGSGENPLPG